MNLFSMYILRWLVVFWFCVFSVLYAGFYPSLTYGKDEEKLRINFVAPKYPPNSPLAKIVGNTWQIYLDGTIDKDAAKRLLTEIIAKDIKHARVYINSPGGSLLTGMEIGRVIRKYGFATYVAKEPRGAKENLVGELVLPGECYSACVLAYIGGYYRYIISNSQIGVHRFHSSSSTDTQMDVAQIVSAAITNYLKEMGVDVGLFDRMSRAGKDELYILSENELNSLLVLNSGTLPAKWTIEVANNVIYLKGEQETHWGIGKAMFSCGGDGSVLFAPFYNAGTNAKSIVDNGRRFSMRFDDDDFVPLGEPAAPLMLHNNYIEAIFVLRPEHLKRLMTATSVGWAVHPGNPDIFWGFTVNTTGNKEKINAFIKSCLSVAGNSIVGK